MNSQHQTLLTSLNLLLLLLLAGCSTKTTNHPPTLSYQTINGRDNGIPYQRTPVYRVKVPLDWIRQDPEPTESILDSTKALCEFWIVDDSGIDSNNKIRIAIHNFPTERMDQRTPPIAQINRWKRQFTSLASIDTKISPQAFSGYSGMLFEGSGMIKGAQTTVLAWSMQMAPEHYRNINLENNPLGNQMRADFTIKASGPTSLLLKHKSAIVAFANSFELIEDIPGRS